MLEIKKFQHKHVCNSRRCPNLDAYTIGPEGEHPMFKQFYCKEHLMEMAIRISEFFEMDVRNLDDTEIETMGQIKEIATKLEQSLEIPKEHFETEPLLAEIEELKTQLAAKPKETIDIEPIKAELESVKATNELFKETIDRLESENNKLKQANKTPIKKPQSSKKKGR